MQISCRRNFIKAVGRRTYAQRGKGAASSLTAAPSAFTCPCKVFRRSSYISSGGIRGDSAISRGRQPTSFGRGSVAALAETHIDSGHISRVYRGDIQILVARAPTAWHPIAHMLCSATVNAVTITRGNQPPYAVINTLGGIVAEGGGGIR